MKVKLVSYTVSALDIKTDDWEASDKMDGKELVAFCARVSNPSNQMNKMTSDRLINYLIKHKHWSPFEMVDMCFEIETTRDIARQMLRHRSFSFQEFSQRYADPTTDLGFELREARLQDPKNRQNSIEINSEGENVALIQEWYARQTKVIEAAREAYEWAIENGLAKEVARAPLPEGNTMTRLYMKGNMRSWIHYIELRSANGTQKEHAAIALECAKIVSAFGFNVEPERHDMVQGN
jgi:thymidylate synthase (FAD)